MVLRILFVDMLIKDRLVLISSEIIVILNRVDRN